MCIDKSVKYAVLTAMTYKINSKVLRLKESVIQMHNLEPKADDSDTKQPVRIRSQDVQDLLLTAIFVIRHGPEQGNKEKSLSFHFLVIL